VGGTGMRAGIQNSDAAAIGIGRKPAVRNKNPAGTHHSWLPRRKSTDPSSPAVPRVPVDKRRHRCYINREMMVMELAS